MQSSIRAITIWQPWASLIIIGAKPYEFRTRSFLDDRFHESCRKVGIHLDSSDSYIGHVLANWG